MKRRKEKGGSEGEREEERKEERVNGWVDGQVDKLKLLPIQARGVRAKKSKSWEQDPVLLLPPDTPPHATTVLPLPRPVK